MDPRKSVRPGGEDVPIIGDYSEAQNARLRPDKPPAPSVRQPPPARRAQDERWLIDSRDVDRYARTAGARKRGPVPAKVLRYSFIALALVIAFLVYWNFATLREITVDFSPLTSRLGGDASASRDATRFGEESGAASVEAPIVVGDEAALDVAAAPAAAPDVTAAGVPGDPLPAANEAPVPAPEVIEEAPAAPVAEPGDGGDAPAAAPAQPETFEFAVAVTTVSESAPAAAVLILRNGGDRGASSVTWWTSAGTATAGLDYADLGRVVERFPRGAQNRTLRVPIVGDRVAEEPETFYVYFAPGEDPGDAADAPRVEVVIEDDD